MVAYAKQRHIQIIPEIDMPGHATAAVRAYLEFGGGGTKEMT
jgi:hexosaminidase